MYRVHLSQEQREELKRLARDKRTMPRTRDRLEMVRRSDAGWSIPKIARHLDVDEQRVRFWIKAFLAGGFDALPGYPCIARVMPHPGRTSILAPQILEALRDTLAQGNQTWTARQIAGGIATQYGVPLSPSHLRRLLRRAKLSYKRTTRSLEHKQKPEEVEAKEADLLTLKKGHRLV